MKGQSGSRPSKHWEHWGVSPGRPSSAQIRSRSGCAAGMELIVWKHFKVFFLEIGVR